MSKAAAVFDELAKKLKETPDMVSKVGCVYQWNITDGNEIKGTWTMDLKNAPGCIKSGAPEKADCTLTVSEEDFLSMMKGTLNAQQAFFQKKLKIAGNIMLSQKLSVILQQKGQSKL